MTTTIRPAARGTPTHSGSGPTSAEALRAAFDRSFAEPRPSEAPAMENLLAIRISGEPYAISLDEIASVSGDRKVVPVPSRARALAGMASMRGILIAVYDLGELLGYPPAPSARWIAVASGGVPIAFTFDELVAQVRLPASTTSTLDRLENAASTPRGELEGLIDGGIEVHGTLHPVIRLQRAVATIGARVTTRAPSQGGGSMHEHRDADRGRTDR